MKEYKSLLSLLKEEDAAAAAYNAFMGAYEHEMRMINEGAVKPPVADETKQFIDRYFERAQEARQRLFAAKMAICAYFTTDELEGDVNA